MQISKTIVDKVLSEELAVMTQDAMSEDWLENSESILGQAIRTCICTPLKSSSGLLGLLYADSKRSGFPFSHSDFEFFTAFSNQAASAIENSQLLKIALEKERLEQEIRVAQQIQEKLFPESTPNLKQCDIFGKCEMMESVGGDYYDFFTTDPDTLFLTVGDVSGHGIPAALLMTMTKSALRMLAQIDRKPAKILSSLNEFLSREMLSRMFVTLQIAVLDLRSGILQIASAGHPMPLYLPEGSAEPFQLPKSRGSLPLGMSRWARLKPQYKATSLQLNPGDLLLLFTDGILETFSPQGEEFGIENLKYTLNKYKELPPKELINQIFTEVEKFRQTNRKDDDLTAVALKWFSL